MCVCAYVYVCVCACVLSAYPDTDVINTFIRSLLHFHDWQEAWRIFTHDMPLWNALPNEETFDLMNSTCTYHGGLVGRPLKLLEAHRSILRVAVTSGSATTSFVDRSGNTRKDEAVVAVAVALRRRVWQLFLPSDMVNSLLDKHYKQSRRNESEKKVKEATTEADGVPLLLRKPPARGLWGATSGSNSNGGGDKLMIPNQHKVVYHTVFRSLLKMPFIVASRTSSTFTSTPISLIPSSSAATSTTKTTAAAATEVLSLETLESLLFTASVLHTQMLADGLTFIPRQPRIAAHTNFIPAPLPPPTSSSTGDGPQSTPNDDVAADADADERKDSTGMKINNKYARLYRDNARVWDVDILKDSSHIYSSLIRLTTLYYQLAPRLLSSSSVEAFGKAPLQWVSELRIASQKLFPEWWASIVTEQRQKLLDRQSAIQSPPKSSSGEGKEDKHKAKFDKLYAEIERMVSDDRDWLEACQIVLQRLMKGDRSPSSSSAPPVGTARAYTYPSPAVQWTSNPPPVIISLRQWFEYLSNPVDVHLKAHPSAEAATWRSVFEATYQNPADTPQPRPISLLDNDTVNALLFGATVLCDDRLIDEILKHVIQHNHRCASAASSSAATCVVPAMHVPFQLSSQTRRALSTAQARWSSPNAEKHGTDTSFRDQLASRFQELHSIGLY